MLIIVYPDKTTRFEACLESNARMGRHRPMCRGRLVHEITATTRFGIGVPFGHADFFPIAASVLRHAMYDPLADRNSGSLVWIEGVDYEVTMDLYPEIEAHDREGRVHRDVSRATMDWIKVQIEMILVSLGHRRMSRLQWNHHDMVTYFQFESVHFEYD